MQLIPAQCIPFHLISFIITVHYVGSDRVLLNVSDGNVRKVVTVEAEQVFILPDYKFILMKPNMYACTA